GNDGIWYTTTQDGLSWEEQTRVDIGMAIGEKTSPTAINFNKKLYLLWKGRGKDGFWFTSRKGGEKWEEQRRVYGVKNDESHLVEEDIILSSPSVAVGLGHLFLCWSEASKSFRGDWEYKLYVLKDPLAIRSLSTWMEDLFSGSREKTPLNEIFIPGTHDSATYNVTTDSDLAEIEIKEGRKNINYPKSFIAPWSKAQDTTIEKQLEAGIRFFDLRPCVKKYAKCDNDKPEFWISHSLFSVKLDDVLKQVKSFLEKNKKEIVILDLRYIWGFSTAADRTKYSEYLYDEICTSLGGKEKLIDFPPPYTPDASMPTIGEIWEDKGRVLLLWNVCSDNNGSGVSDKFMQDHSTFWDSGRWACKVGEGDQYNTAEKKIERINTQLEIMEQYKAFNCKALYLVKCEIDIGDDALAHIQDWLNGLKALAESNHKMIKHIEGCEGWSNKIKGGVFTFDYYNNCEVVDMIIALNNK
ncbi:MAG: hypothetical protein SAJ72_19045, partial [Jaaginema sp. PMC 1080.18]|nr:hypothetical protein [Jaaginema sp. PMC 1080.18]